MHTLGFIEGLDAAELPSAVCRNRGTLSTMSTSNSHNLLLATICAALFSLVAAALTGREADADDVKRVNDAVAVLDELTTAPDNAIPRGVLEKAEAIAIFPGLKKGGFIVGGQWGYGVISVRDASGSWSSPAFLRLAGGSFGAQIGAQAVDLVLVVMNRRGVDNLLRNDSRLAARPPRRPGQWGGRPGPAPTSSCGPRS